MPPEDLGRTIASLRLRFYEEVHYKDTQRFETIIAHLDKSSAEVMDHLDKSSDKVFTQLDKSSEKVLAYLNKHSDKVLAHLNQHSDKVLAHLDQSSKELLTVLTSIKALLIGLTVLGSLVLLISSVMFYCTCLRKSKLRIEAQEKDMEKQSSKA